MRYLLIGVLILGSFILIGCENTTTEPESNTLEQVYTGDTGPGLWTCVMYYPDPSKHDDYSYYLEKYSFTGDLTFRMGPVEACMRSSILKSTGEMYLWELLIPGESRICKRTSAGDVLTTYETYSSPFSLDLNQSDGSLWFYYPCLGNDPCKVIRLDADLNSKAEYQGIHYVNGIGCYYADGSCWVVGVNSAGSLLVRLDANGNKLFEKVIVSPVVSSGEYTLRVDQTDGSCWVLCEDSGNIRMEKYNQSGDLVSQISITERISNFCTSSVDGSLCVINDTHNKIYRYNNTGNLLWELSNTELFMSPWFMPDNSIWVSMDGGSLIHITAAGVLDQTLSCTDFPEYLTGWNG